MNELANQFLASQNQEEGPPRSSEIINLGNHLEEMGSESAPQGSFINIKVAYGLRQHNVSIHSHSTFGQVKVVLASLTGVDPQHQRLLFKGRQVADGDLLCMTGLQDKSKLLLVEDAASKERKWEEAKRTERIAKACQAVEHVRGDVDKLVIQVSSLQVAVVNGNKVSENEFRLLAELLMRQLLKLDSIEAEGEAKMQRKNEVHRIQKCADLVDSLKIQNDNALIGSTVVTSEWETFDANAGNIIASLSSSSTKMTTEWESFD